MELCPAARVPRRSDDAEHAGSGKDRFSSCLPMGARRAQENLQAQLAGDGILE